MPGIDVRAVGRRADPFVRTWTDTDALLYALGVGAGQADPLSELEFTTENSEGISQQVIPSFAIPLAQTGLAKQLPFGDYPRGALVHAEQALEVHQALPASGAIEIAAHIAGIYDKGSGALVRIETTSVDAASRQPLVTTRLGYFIRGAGGFGGPAAPGETWSVPEGPPDQQLVSETRPDQALLYRLSGDRNPLHSDPKFAAAAEFRRPILHGLCTFGIVTRQLLQACCGGDPARFGAMSARFTKPVYPGDALTTSLWVMPDGLRFRTTTQRGDVVLDRGSFVNRFV